MRQRFVTASVASRAVDGERCWGRVRRVVPGSGESHAVVVSARGDGSVVAQVRHRHVRSALGFSSVPKLRDGLAVGEAPGQRPVGDPGRACVVDGDGRLETSGPLVRDGVGDVAGETTGRRRCGCASLRRGC